MSTGVHNPIQRPLVVAGYSSQALASEMAAELRSRVVDVTRRQYSDKEIQVTIDENVRGHDVVVVASASGDPNKQEKEARLLMRAANRAGAKRVTLVLPYMWYGRSDDIWDERNAPALVDTIETLRGHCQSVVVADPHNSGLTREKFLDAGSPVRSCIIAHFAFIFAVQLKTLIDSRSIDKTQLLLSHADAGSTKRISRSFRSCIYRVLDIARSADQDDWAQGLKDRDKLSGKIRIKGFSHSVAGKDVVVFEDIIGSGSTACDLAALLKDMGANSVTVFATSGLFTTDLKSGEILTSSVDRIDRSRLDRLFITDTYSHEFTDPAIHDAIKRSKVIHTLRTSAYLASIVRALHAEVNQDAEGEHNSVSAILKGSHPDQLINSQTAGVPQNTSARQLG